MHTENYERSKNDPVSVQPSHFRHEKIRESIMAIAHDIRIEVYKESNSLDAISHFQDETHIPPEIVATSNEMLSFFHQIDKKIVTRKGSFKC